MIIIESSRYRIAYDISVLIHFHSYACINTTCISIRKSNLMPAIIHKPVITFITRRHQKYYNE